MQDVRIRRATYDDIPSLETIIAASARGLSGGHYAPEQVEGALRGAFGVDTQIIRDGSYFVLESAGRTAGCGGWSRRRTLFGSDARAERDAGELDPAVDAARIRAFFILPEFARRGLGSLLLEHCEREAVAYGFRRFELMATLPGVRLYSSRGYDGSEPVDWPMADGLSIRFVPMSKLAPRSPWRIGQADIDDAAAILELQKRAYESEARLYNDWNIPPLMQTLESLRGEFAASLVLKCVDDDEGGRLIGSVRAREFDGTCQIGRLVVAPERQGKSIGTRLMREIEARFPATPRFELFTGSLSEANIRLYERLGYSRCRKQTISRTLTLVFMEKKR